MRYTTDDLRIKEIRELTPPAHLIREFPCEEPFARTVHGARMAAHEILHGHDDRLLVIVGPCSIHDPKAAMEYAQKLNEERRRLAGDLEIIMRVYFEKPRTTVGWKGLMNDPDMDGSCRINHGLRIARELLCDIVALGLPTGVEYLDMITPQYIADLVSWGAIGARTTESQSHRQLASGLSCPVGFKNGTDGNIKVAVAYDVTKAPAGGSTVDIINGSGGHVIADDIWSTDGVHDQGYDQNAGTVKKPDGTPISTGTKSEEKKESDDKDQKSDDSKKEDNKSSDSSKSDSKGDSSQSKQNSSNSQGSGSNNSSSNGGSQKKWVAEQGHWETDYSQVWVPNVVYTRHERYICSACGASFDSIAAWSAHSDAMWEQGQDHGAYINDSYTTSEDQGHYEQKATGQHWVVDVAGHWE